MRVRPGKRERARVKRRVKSEVWLTVPSVGHVHIKYGPKKADRVLRWSLGDLETDKSSLSGNLLNAKASKSQTARLQESSESLDAANFHPTGGMHRGDCTSWGPVERPASG